jgi:hypothetical protein
MANPTSISPKAAYFTEQLANSLGRKNPKDSLLTTAEQSST